MAELSQARVRELFNYDPETGVLTWRERSSSEFSDRSHAMAWNTRFSGKEVGGICSIHGYRRVRMLDREWRAHRIIWLYHYGEWPKHEIDHINGVRHDNRLTNLRSVSHTENMRNIQMHGRNTSGDMGVTYVSRDSVWKAHIGVGGRHIHLGNFQTMEEACAARKAAERVLEFHPNHGRDPTHREHRRKIA